MKPKKKSIRLWAVVFWLLVWQGASMALAALYPHGALLLASPLSALARLGELAVTAAFWRTALTSAARILGGFLLACALAVVLAALAARYRRAEELLAPLRAKLPDMCYASDLGVPLPEIACAALGNDAGLIGAACLCL